MSPVRPLVVLAVDDDLRRAEYAYLLSATGFDVATAGNDPSSPARVPDRRPSVIVADVSDVRSDGWTPVQRFKHDPRTRDVPLVAIADEVGTATREHARLEGCVAVCSRTCPVEELAAGLRAVLARF